MSKNNRIGLCMIVKNESKVITRCLESLTDIIDEYLIVDTGSTDNTIGVIQDFFMQHPRIEGKVVNREWINFGHNRTESLELAKEMNVQWILTVDADMVMSNKGFDPKQLDKNISAYTIVQDNGGLIYDNLRLLNSDFKWRSVGVTHEYLDADGSSNRGRLATLYIKDIGDGGAKSDKFERDIRLLTQGLKDEPDNARYMFYLAQSYKDIGDMHMAIKWYNERIKRGGWTEEVYYSLYMKAECLKFVTHEEDVIITAYEKAISQLPHRAEAMCALASYCRTLSRHWHVAYKWTKIAKSLPLPVNDILFIEKDCYEWRALDEFSIAAYYVGEYTESYDATKKLLDSQNLPKDHKQRVESNLKLVETTYNSLNSINTYFNKVYIINLNTRKDRWQKIENRLRKHGITNYQRVEALPGSLFEGFPTNAYLQNRNYIGCLMSHVKAVLDAKANNYKRILILEDDAVFHKDLNALFGKVKKELDEEHPKWDLLYLGHGTFYQDNKQNWHHEQGKIFGDKLVGIASGTWTGHAYGVSEEFYDTIIDNYTKNDYTKWKELDRWYVEDIQTNTKTYTCLKVYPQLFLQDVDFADNINQVKLQNREFVNKSYSTYEDYE